MRARESAPARRTGPAPASLLVGVYIALSLVAGGLTGELQANPIQLFEGDYYVGRSPKNATVPAVHQYVYQGIVMNSSGQPQAGVAADQLTLRFNAPCANPVALHPDGPSDANGVVTWGAEALNQGGGSCTGYGVMEIERVDWGVVWELSAVRSPDQDGDGLVALYDLVVWQQAFVNQTPLHQGDLDLDGSIALSDLARWQQHLVAP